jgi:hypothetical protein
MTVDHRSRCERCNRDLGEGRQPFISYGVGAGRRHVCTSCLSWAEKDAFLSLTPRKRAAAERAGRFSRPVPGHSGGTPGQLRPSALRARST